jgi:plastocyanin
MALGVWVTAMSIPIAACSDGGNDRVTSVVALDNSFRPETVEIAVGDRVSWENRGEHAHNLLHVELDSAELDSAELDSAELDSAELDSAELDSDGDDLGVAVADFQPGDAFTHQFTEPGIYNYYCSIHGSSTIGMIGTVIVTERRQAETR